jgi:hypothetical protein
MYLLRRVVGPNESSHVLLVTHDPLVVGSLRKEQVQVFSFKEGKRVWIAPPKEDPIGMGVAGLLTSELFGLRSELDLETLRKLDRKKDLAVKDELTPDEKAELLKLDEELATMGFLTTFRDPMYTQFLKALSEFDQSKTPTLTPQEREEQARLAKEIVTKLMMKQK